MKRSHPIGVTAILCFVAIFLSCAPLGQRLLTVQVESQGKVLFEGIRGVPDSTPIHSMWDELDKVPLEVSSIEAHATDKSEQKEWQLQGPLLVRIKHGPRELAQSTVETLTVHKGEAGTTWKLDRDEVNRIKARASKKN